MSLTERIAALKSEIEEAYYWTRHGAGRWTPALSARIAAAERELRIAQDDRNFQLAQAAA